MKQVIIECANSAESDALWQQYGTWTAHYTKFLKELSYDMVLKNFQDILSSVMVPLL